MECLGCQKAEHSPLAFRHESLFFTILLGTLEGSRRQEVDAKEEKKQQEQRKDGVANLPVSWDKYPRTPQYKQSRLLPAASSPRST